MRSWLGTIPLSCMTQFPKRTRPQWLHEPNSCTSHLCPSRLKTKSLHIVIERQISTSVCYFFYKMPWLPKKINSSCCLAHKLILNNQGFPCRYGSITQGKKQNQTNFGSFFIYLLLPKKLESKDWGNITIFPNILWKT
jgi:hypothetical protein